MYLDKILVLTDKKELLLSYEVLLQEYTTVETKLLNSTDRDVKLEGYGIIIADLHLKTNVKKFLDISEFYKFTRELLVLVSFFDSLELQEFETSLKYISFIIKKPFATSKLTNFIDKEIYKMKQISLISNKADILIDILDLHPSRIAVYDNDGFFFYANLDYIKAYELSLEGDKKKDFDSIVFSDYSFDVIKSKLFTLKSFSFEKKEQDSWQENIFFYTNSKYIIHISSDITSKKQKEIHLELASNFFENTSEGIIVADRNGDIESVNKAFSTITGYGAKEAVGNNPRFLKSGLHDKEFYINMFNCIKANGHWKGEVWNKRKNGQIYPQVLSISKTTSTSNKSGYYMSIFTDISSIKEADKKVHYHANYDSLTTLPNREYFSKHLEDVIKNANETQVAVFFIDIDKFKDVNDTYGHDIGDDMLVTIAKRVLNSVRKDDFVARIGGDEFVLVAKDIKNKQNVEKLAKKIQKKVNQTMDLDGKVFTMGLSMGIALYPQHGTTSRELLKNADIAMYEVKEYGRNNFKIYTEHMGTKILTKSSMMLELKRAITKKEFVVYFQPVINFQNKSIFGAEALIRWNHPEKGIIPPDAFLKYIFSSELEIEFGGLVVEGVLENIQELNRIYPNNNLSIAINISRGHFFSPSFCSDMANMLKKYNVQSSQIEIEVLETQIMYNIESAKEIITNLSKMGYKISLDDFGVEYSSLNYLKEFQVDKLKIDRSFIQEIGQDPHELKIAQSIINIGKVFGLQVQAEGIEDLCQYESVKDSGADFSQGYYHSKPIEFQEFVRYYKQNIDGIRDEQ